MNRYSTALALVATMMLISQTSISAYGQISSAQLFGCQKYGGTTHCDFLKNKMDVYEVAGNSTLIHPLTNTYTLFVDGKLGRAMEMRGEYRESVEIMNSPELNPKQFSISFWIKSTKIEPYGHIVSHSNRQQTSGWQFDVFRSSSSSGSGGGQSGSELATLRFGVFNTNGTLFSPANIQLPTEKFTLITGTFDGSKVRLYVDGLLTGEKEFVGQYNSDPGLPLRIGSASYCSSCNRWSGIIDEIRIYDRMLGDDEIKQLFDMSDVSSDLVGYWK